MFRSPRQISANSWPAGTCVRRKRRKGTCIARHSAELLAWVPAVGRCARIHPKQVAGHLVNLARNVVHVAENCKTNGFSLKIRAAMAMLAILTCTFGGLAFSIQDSENSVAKRIDLRHVPTHCGQPCDLSITLAGHLRLTPCASGSKDDWVDSSYLARIDRSPK